MEIAGVFLYLQIQFGFNRGSTTDPCVLWN